MVVDSMMSVFAERMGAPRTLGVEFPFGYPCGPPGDAALQTRVMRAALDLPSAPGPAPVVAHFPEAWGNQTQGPGGARPGGAPDGVQDPR